MMKCILYRHFCVNKHFCLFLNEFSYGKMDKGHIPEPEPEAVTS